MLPGPGKMGPDSPGRHPGYGFYILDGLVLHIKQKNHCLLCLRKVAYSQIQVLMSEPGGRISAFIRPPCVLLRQFFPLCPHYPGLIVIEAIIGNPEKPCREFCPAFEALKRHICLQHRFLRQIVCPERVPSAKRTKESAQRFLLMVELPYELIPVH